MKINKYGVVLESLTLETAELVRVWRNSPEINKFMDFQKEISVDQQKYWFGEIQKEKSDFFLIRKDETPIGLIHIEKINLDERFAHVGLFVGDVDYHGSGLALAASLSLLDYAFDTLSLKTVLAKVKDDNEQVIAYNSFLGFEKYERFDGNFSYWMLTKKQYERRKPALLKYVSFI